MKKTLLFSFACIAMIASSCAKEEIFEPAEQVKPEGVVPMTFTATTEATKAVLDADLEFQWEVGDSITIWDGAYNNKFIATAVNGNSATFYGEAKDTTEYVAIYPYRESQGAVGYKFTTNNTVAQANIPNKQTLVNGKNIDSNALICAAVAGADKNLHFTNIGGLIKLTIAEEGITGVTIKADKKISGNFTFALPTEETPYSAVSIKPNAVANVNLIPENGTFEKGQSYYIVVLPDTYAAGMTVAFSKENAQAFRTTKKEITVERSSGVDLGAGLFTGITWLSDEINTKDEFMTFAEYASVYPAEKTIRLGADIDLGAGETGGVLIKESSIVEKLTCSFDGQNHCIYNFLIDGTGSTNLGVFTNVVGDISNVTFGSKDGFSYDGVSEISFPGSNAVWYNIAPIAVCSGNITNVMNFATVFVDNGNKSSSTRVAGICANFTGGDKVISKCVNYGRIQNASGAGKPAEHQVGGIICNIDVAHFTVSGCVNFGDVYFGIENADIKLTGAKRCSAVGGVIGMMKVKTPLKSRVENCSNYGTVGNISTIGPGNFTTDHLECMVGGIVGRASSAPDGGEKANVYTGLHNYGDVIGTANTVTMLGGIIGRCDQGNKLLDCHNHATIKFDASTAAKKPIEIGGILGKAWGLNISGCTNEGDVYSNKKNVNHVGGIAGTLDYSIVSNCSNSGSITNESNCHGTSATNDEQVVGGIVAVAEKNETEIAITNCTNTGGVSGYLFGKNGTPVRNIAGGIVGSIEPAAISGGAGSGSITVANNTNTGRVIIDNLSVEGMVVGGIVGSDVSGILPSDRNPVTMSGNVNRGDLDVSTSNTDAVPALHQAGGVVGRADYVISDGDKSVCYITSTAIVDDPETTQIGALFGINTYGHFTNGKVGGSILGVSLSAGNFESLLGVISDAEGATATVSGTTLVSE